MLDEYAEIIERHISPLASEAVLGVLMNLPNLERIHTYFRFNLLDDPDDNKFVDCAIASNARFIVSHGRDFRKLRETKFLSVKVISADDFRKILDV